MLADFGGGWPVARLDREAAADEVEGVVRLDGLVDQLFDVTLGRRGLVGVEGAHLGLESLECARAPLDALRRLGGRPEGALAADEDVEEHAKGPDVDLLAAMTFAAQDFGGSEAVDE